MKLSDYQTPKTNSLMETFAGSRIESNALRMTQHARDLERKLSKCRNVLSGLMLGFGITGQHRSADKCKTALEETK